MPSVCIRAELWPTRLLMRVPRAGAWRRSSSDGRGAEPRACGGEGSGGGGGGGGRREARGAKRGGGPRTVETARPEAWPTADASSRRHAGAGGAVQVAARVDGAVTQVRVDLGDRCSARGGRGSRRTVRARRRPARCGDEPGSHRPRAVFEQLAAQSWRCAADRPGGTKVSVLRAQKASASRQLRDTSGDGLLPARSPHVRGPGWTWHRVAALRLSGRRAPVALQVPERHAAAVVEGSAMECARELARACPGVGGAGRADGGSGEPHLPDRGARRRRGGGGRKRCVRGFRRGGGAARPASRTPFAFRVRRCTKRSVARG